MLCSGCGKKIPFTGSVCPYCHRDKSDDKKYQTLALIIGIPAGWIGYEVFGFWGAVSGLLIGGCIALVFSERESRVQPKNLIAETQQQDGCPCNDFTDRKTREDERVTNQQQEQDREPEPKQYWEIFESVPVEARLRIQYKNRKGEITRRTIKTSWYDGSSFLNAFCELRTMTRTFRIERIIDCLDTDTGEIVNDIPAYLLDKYRKSETYSLLSILEKAHDVLAVLFYVGKSDGQLRAEERGILCRFIRKISNDDRLTDEMINREFNRFSVPSLQSFKLAINRICKANPKNMVVTYKVALKIVGTQKTVHPRETEALEYMLKKMAKENITP